MVKQSELEQIKELIKKGFALELISFELDVPIETVEMCKIQLENEQVKRTYVAEKRNADRNKSVDLKMSQMREKYETLFSDSNKEEPVKKTQKLTQQEIDVINSVIATIEKIIGELKETSTPNKSASAVVREIEKITDYQLTTEQSEKLNNLMRVEEFNRLDKRRNRSCL